MYPNIPLGRFWRLLFGSALLLLPMSKACASAEGNSVGLVLAAKVSGTVQVTTGGKSADLKLDSVVSPRATLKTGADGQAVLVFSNGGTLQAGADTELVVEEFLQRPFAQTVKVADIIAEPSTSHTRLALNRGEIVASVKKLNVEKGSSYTVQTRVGTVSARDGVFRVVFRSVGTEQVIFELSVAQGEASFAGGKSGPAGEKIVPAGQTLKFTVDLRPEDPGSFQR